MDFVLAAHPSLRSLLQKPENSQRQLNQNQTQNRPKRQLVISDSSDEDEELIEDNPATPENTRATQAGIKIRLLKRQ